MKKREGFLFVCFREISNSTTKTQKMMAQAIPNSGPGSGIPPGQGKTREDMPKAVSKDKENMTKTKDKDKRQEKTGNIF